MANEIFVTSDDLVSNEEERFDIKLKVNQNFEFLIFIISLLGLFFILIAFYCLSPEISNHDAITGVIGFTTYKGYKEVLHG